MEYKEFKKVAAELLGDQRNYKQAFDINTAYKALRSVVSRVRNETKEWWLEAEQELTNIYQKSDRFPKVFCIYLLFSELSHLPT